MSIKAIRWAYGLFEIIDIPPQERAVLVALCYHHNDKTGDCYPSQDTLSLLTGYRRQRVVQAISWLKKSGLVGVEKTQVGGKFQGNKYRLFGSFSGRTMSPHPDTGKCKSVSPRPDTAKASTVSKKKDTVRVPPSGHGDHVPPSGHYRGNIYTPESDDENVVNFPSQEMKKLGGSNA